QGLVRLVFPLAAPTRAWARRVSAVAAASGPRCPHPRLGSTRPRRASSGSPTLPPPAPGLGLLMPFLPTNPAPAPPRALALPPPAPGLDTAQDYRYARLDRRPLSVAQSGGRASSSLPPASPLAPGSG